MEKRNVEKEDIDAHDEDEKDIDMELDKEALITESENVWNQGNLKQPGNNLVLEFYLYLNHCNFMSFFTALLENGPGGLKN